ncbi:MAG TPA: diguanylate cyclase [Candidatus Xenobia bacterium]|jgi:diguanylate cyclase (GGDEF)-like protein
MEPLAGTVQGRVLIVADNTPERHELAQLLIPLGVSVDVAENGQAGLKRLEQVAYDVLLVDPQLPDLPGPEIFRTLVAVGLVLANKTDTDVVVSSLVAGAADCLLRPFEAVDVCGRVRAGLARARLQHQLRNVSSTDEMTGLPNRGGVLRSLRQLWAMHGRSGAPLSCLLVDIDGFQSVNKRGGHEQGDAAVRGLSQTLQDIVRTSDVLGRWGTEEFLLICPETGRDAAAICADRILDQVRIRADITVSIGLAESRAYLDMMAMLQAAQRALQAAQERGGDRQISDGGGGPT